VAPPSEMGVVEFVMMHHQLFGVYSSESIPLVKTKQKKREEKDAMHGTQHSN